MPYTSANAPDHVKKLPDKQRRQWLHIFNGCMADGKDESKCFKMANGVAAKELDPNLAITLETAELLFEAKDYQYVDSHEYSEHQISPQSANYDPLGAGDGKGCANCQFFIAPSRCSVVAGTISPTGLSSMWRPHESYVASPIPVTIVADERSTTAEPPSYTSPGTEISVGDTNPSEPAGTSRPNSEAAWWRKLIPSLAKSPGSAATPSVSARAFSLVKQKDGRTRFYTVWSNNFKDREGEIFTKAAHKEFVEWATKTGEYPELWLWHTYGSKFGQVDWLDASDDGFVHASGLIDAGKEVLAETVAREDNGVSHGFFGLQAGNLIHWYRSYELSVLPLKNAAVWTTSFNLLNAGKATEEMGFTPERRKFFTEIGISEEQIKEWEKSTDGLADALKAAGLESKAADMGVAVEPPPTPEQVAEGNFRVETTRTLMGLQEMLTTLATQVKAIDERTKDIKSGDAVVAAAMTPQVQPVQASKSDDNVVSVGSPEADASRSFFENTVLAPLIGQRS